jgi:MFS family permease
MTTRDIAPSPAPAKPVSSLRGNRQFRLFWFGETVSQVGDRISELALPLIAVTMLGVGAGQAGILTAVIWLPNVLAAVVGAWVDRRANRRRLLIAADIGRAVVLLSVPAAYLLGAITFVQLCLVGLLTGVGQVLFQMAYQAFYVSLVPPESYVDANSRLSVSRGVSFVVGPAVGGFLVQLLTAPVAVIADALSFLGSAAVLRRIRTVEAPPAPSGEPIGRMVRDGLGMVLRERALRAILFCCAGANFFTYIGFALTILYANRILGLSAGEIGLAFGVGAVGAVVGAAVTPWVSRPLGVGPAAILGCVIFTTPMALLVFAGGTDWQKVAFLAGYEFVGGVGVMLFDININAVLTRATPDDARGRRAGAFTTVNYGLRPLGALAGGAFGTLFGVRPSLVVAGVGATVGVLWLIFSPVRSIRAVDDVLPGGLLRDIGAPQPAPIAP